MATNKRSFVYDIEVFPNYFCCVVKELGIEGGDGITVYEIADLVKLEVLMMNPDNTWVGYNNDGYDAQVLSYAFRLIKDVGADTLHRQIYNYSHKLIDGELTKGETLYLPFGNQIDLMNIVPPHLKVGDGGSTGSLKKQEFRMHWGSLVDWHGDWNEDLPAEDIPKVIEYCINDVLATEAFLWEIADSGGLEVRHALTVQYPFLQRNEAFVRTDSALATRIMKHLYNESADARLTVGKVPLSWMLDINLIIFKNIRFQKDINKTALEHLRRIPAVKLSRYITSEDEDEDEKSLWNYGVKELNNEHLAGIEFEFQGHYTDLAVGGAHFFPKQRHEHGNLVDIDVASYYPRILLNNGKSPKHCKEVWLKEFEKIVDMRLAYKAAGNKVGADALKIIINSLYGKLNAMGVFLDPILALTVTINGQLMLFELMEDLELAGFEIVSANTDGVLVDAGDREEELKALRDAWCERHDLEAGFDKYEHYIASNINDYILIDEDGGLKSKGLYAQNIKLPDVCKIALREYFVNNVPVADTVRAESNIHNFLFFGGAGNAVRALMQGDDELQGSIRFYKTTKDVPRIFKYFKKGNKQQLPNGDKAVVVNYIEDKSVPDDVDYDYYIDKTNTFIGLIEGGAVGDVKGNEVRIKADKVKVKTGLFTVQKGREDKAKANLTGTIPTTIEAYNEYTSGNDWYNFNGYGCMTGSAFNTLAIDVDDIEDAIKAGLFEHVTKSHADFAAWHDTTQEAGVAELVRTGKKRGTLFFQYSGAEFETSGEEFASEFGFEILYGKKVAQLYGKHTNGDTYLHTAGTVKPLPDKLRKYLLRCLQDQSFFDKGTSRKKVELKNKNLPTNEGHEYKGSNFTLEDHDLRAAKSKRIFEDYNGLLATTKAVADSDTINKIGFDIDGYTMVGECPWHTDGEYHPLTLQFRERKLEHHCHGSKCTQARGEYVADLTEFLFHDKKDVGTVDDTITVDENVAPVVPPKEIATIDEAMRLKDKFKIILGGTGIGKTYGSTKYALEVVDFGAFIEDPNHERYIIAVPSIDRINGVLDELFNHAGIVQGENSKYETAFQHGICPVMRTTADMDVPDNWKIIITHFTYLQRKGDSHFYYPVMKHFSKDVHVIMDEVDAFVTNATISIPFGARTYERGIGQLEIWDKCPQSAVPNQTSLSCHNCTFKKEAYTYGYDRTINVFNLSRRHIEAGVDYPVSQQTDLEEFYGRVESDSTIMDTTNIKFLEQYTMDDEELLVDSSIDGGIMGDIDEYINDVRNSAWHPCVHIDHPVNAQTGEPVDPDWIRKETWTDSRKVTDEIIFPYYACKVPKFVTVDRKPMAHILQNCKSFTGLTATMPEMYKDFIHDCGADVHYYEVPAAEDRKIKNVKLILIKSNSSNNYMRKLFRGIKLNGKRVLVFFKDKTTAKKEYKALKDDVGDLRIAKYNESDELTMNHCEFDRKPDITMMYNRATHARGANMGQYHVAMIAGDAMPPLCFCAGSSKEEIEKAVMENRRDIIIQAEGRNMRPDDDGNIDMRYIILDVSRLYIDSGNDGEMSPDALSFIKEAFVDNLGKLAKDWDLINLTDRKGEFLVTSVNHIINSDVGEDLKDTIHDLIVEKQCETVMSFRAEFGKAAAKQILTDVRMKETVEGWCRDVKFGKKIDDYLERLSAGESARDLDRMFNPHKWGDKYKAELATRKLVEGQYKE